ncbi:MAG TPA: integrase core domain-containing protein [Candidatus Tectomicrobia bacterium]
MTRCTRPFHSMLHLIGTLLTLLGDIVHFIRLCLRPSAMLAAENLSLRKQLAYYQERHVKPRRVSDVTRFTLVWLSRWFNWRQALAIVQPATLSRWHRQGFRIFWRWKSTPGRPPIPADLQALIRRMARENPTWGQERIANELLLKLGLRVSPRTVRKYMPKRFAPGPGQRITSQRWQTFIRNHAQAIVACDFCVVVTATFRLLYVFVVMDHATRRILHTNVTTRPTAPWTLQQLREAIPADHGYRFLVHDRDSIFSQSLDQHIHHLGLRVLKSPPQSPQANALCERLIGTLRRECFDFLIPLSAHHVRRILREWVPHYNTSRPHMSLGPGIPQPPVSLPVALQEHRHQLPKHLPVVSQPILGGVHHAYALAEKVA